MGGMYFKSLNLLKKLGVESLKNESTGQVESLEYWQHHLAVTADETNYTYCNPVKKIMFVESKKANIPYRIVLTNVSNG